MDNRYTSRGQLGHTLLELLVALSVFALAVALPAVALHQQLETSRRRGAAQAWQSAAAWAQLEELWGGGPVRLESGPRGLRVLAGPSSREVAPPGLLPSPAVNVSRWRAGNTVRIVFSGDFAAPDSAGSLTFGEQGRRFRVVVRAESGLTRRVLQ